MIINSRRDWKILKYFIGRVEGGKEGEKKISSRSTSNTILIRLHQILKWIVNFSLHLQSSWILMHRETACIILTNDETLLSCFITPDVVAKILAFIASVCLLTLKYITSDLVDIAFHFFFSNHELMFYTLIFADGNSLRFTRSLVYAAMECRCVARNWVCLACRIRPRFVIFERG